MPTETPLVPDDKRDGKEHSQGPGKPNDGAPLNPRETSELDQIEAGLREGDEAAEPTRGDSSSGVDLGSPAGPQALAAGKGISILSKGLGRFAAKNKRGLAVGGGIGAVIAIVMLAFIALLPLKLENMVKNIIEKRFARIEFALEKRAEKHVETYVERQARAKVEGSGAKVIATGNLAADLYHNWQANKFEDKLASDLGVSFQWNKDDNTYSITQGIGGKEVLFKGADLEHIGNNEFRSKLNEVVKKETKWNQVYKRHHTRKILTLKFDVKKYYVFPKTREAIAGKAYDAKQYLKHELVARIVEPVSAKYATYFHCIIDGCSEAELREKLGENAISPGSGDSSPGSTGIHDPNAKDSKQVESDSNAAQGHINDGEASNAAEVATHEVESTIESQTGQEAEALFGEEIIKQIQDLMGKSIMKAIGAGIGVLEFISKLDSAIQHDTFGRIVASKNALQYANEFATFATLSDQIKSGQVTGDEVSAVMDQVGDYGTSKPYQRQSGIDPSGQKIQCSGDPKDTTTADVCADKLVNSNGASDVTQAIKDSPLFVPIHVIAVAYNDTVGGVYSVISGITGGLIDDILGPILDKVIEGLKFLGIDINKWMVDDFNKVLGFFFGPIISGNETGPDLYNAVDAGADVTANAEMQSAGATKLPPGQTSQLDPLILQEKIAAAKKESLWQHLTSIDDTNSVASNLIVAFVMTPKQLMGKMSTSFLAFAVSPFRVFANNLPRFAMATTSPAYAANLEAEDPYAVQQYDFSTTTLDASVDDVQRLDGKGPCPADENDPYYQTRINETQDDPCRLELLAVQSLNSVYTTQDDGSLTQAAAATPAAPSGSAQQLAQQIMANPNVSFTTQLGKEAMADAAAGKPSLIEARCQHGEVAQTGLTSATLDPKLLSFVLQAASKYQIGIGYLTNGCHEGSNPGDTTVSAHFYGRAVDLNTVNGQPVTGGEQISWDFLNGVVGFLPSGSGIGQSQCGITSNVQVGPGIRLSQDSCTHIHIQVPQS